MHVVVTTTLIRRASRLAAIAAVCGAIATVSACASMRHRGETGASGPATVTGQVTSDRGAVLADVVVALSGPSFHRTTRTDIAGRFTFEHVPLGQYKLSAAATGYKRASEPVVVDKEGAVRAAVKLRM